MDKNESTQSNEKFEPIIPESIRAIMDNFYTTVKPHIKENCYCNPQDYQRILKEFFKAPNPEKLIINRIDIYPDSDVPANIIFICSARKFEIYKTLVKHPWIDKSAPLIDLYKVTTQLYENELKHPIRDSIEPIFFEGDIFPKTAKYRVDKIDFLKTLNKINL